VTPDPDNAPEPPPPPKGRSQFVRDEDGRIVGMHYGKGRPRSPTGATPPPRLKGRPHRPTPEQVARIEGDDADDNDGDEEDQREEVQRLLAELHDLGVAPNDYRLTGPHGVPTLATVRALHKEMADKAAAGHISGAVRWCPVCERHKHAGAFVRRKVAEWCKDCDKDETRKSQREDVLAELQRQQRIKDYDTRPGAFVDRSRDRLPANSAADEKLRAAAHRAVDRYFDMLPRLRRIKTMHSGFSSTSALATPHVKGGDHADPTARHAVEDGGDVPDGTEDVLDGDEGVGHSDVTRTRSRDDPSQHAGRLTREVTHLCRRLVGAVGQAAALVPDQPEAAGWDTCIECGRHIEGGQRKTFQGRPYHKAPCWQQAYRRANR
jgi:hypothetical protein